MRVVKSRREEPRETKANEHKKGIDAGEQMHKKEKKEVEKIDHFGIVGW